MMVKIITSILFTFLFCKCIYAQNEILDSTFNNGHGFILDEIAPYGSHAFFIKELPNGNILSACNVSLGNTSKVFLLRFNTDGSIDSTFGNNGKSSLGISNRAVFGSDAVIDNNGNIIVSGYCYNYNIDDITYGFIFKFKSNGNIDSTFGNNGVVFGTFGYNSITLNSIVATNQNKIIIASRVDINSWGWEYKLVLFGFDSIGAIDSSFGNNGSVMIDYGQSIESGNPEVVLSMDSGIIVLNNIYNFSTLSKYQLLKYNLSGIPDSTFGINGIVDFLPDNATFINTTGIDTGYITGEKIVIQNDNKIIIAGEYTPYNDYFSQVILSRHNANGSIDSTFGINGFVINNPGWDNEDIGNLTIQNNGKIYLCGTITLFNSDIFITRYTSEGLVDSLFSVDGTAIISLLANYYHNISTCYSVDIQQDGKLLVAGSFSNDSIGATFIVRCLPIKILKVLEKPTDFNKLWVYPNPFEQKMLLNYSLEEASDISISLFDISGKLINNFISNEYKQAGEHSMELVITEKIPTGNYLLVVHAPKKMFYAIIQKE